MTDRCKIGDVAIIIRDEVGCDANVGRMMHVMGPREVSSVNGTMWCIKPVIGTTMTYIDLDGTVDVGEAIDIQHRDSWLLPIRPEPENDAVDMPVELPMEMETV